MLENIIKNFLYFGDKKYIIDMLNFCIENKLIEIGNYIIDYTKQYFTNDLEIMLLLLNFYEMSEKHQELFSILSEIEKFNLDDSINKQIYNKQIHLIPKIQQKICSYNKDIIINIHENQLKNRANLITLVINCKSNIELFEKSINSFLNFCEDYDNIGLYFCIVEYEIYNNFILKQIDKKYPFISFYFKNHKEESQNHTLNIMIEKIKTPYIFYLEDNVVFFKKISIIKDCISNNNFEQCLINYDENNNFILKTSLIKRFIFDRIENFDYINGDFIDIYKSKYKYNTISLNKKYYLNIVLKDDHKNQISKTYVINMNKLKDYNFENYDLVNFLKISQNSYQFKRLFDSTECKTEKEISDILTHLNIYINLINSKYEFYIILEDDINLINNFNTKIDSIYKNIKGKNWDIVILGHHKKINIENNNNDIELKQYSTFESFFYSKGGHFGYMISKNGALKMLEIINRFGAKYPLDKLIQYSADHLNIIYTNKDLVSKNIDIEVSKNIDISDSKRIDYEKNIYSKFYDNIMENLNFEDSLNFSLNSESKGVLFYKGEKINQIYENCIHYKYIIDNSLLVIVANPNDDLKKNYFLDPLKKNLIFDINNIIN